MKRNELVIPERIALAMALALLVVGFVAGAVWAAEPPSRDGNPVASSTSSSTTTSSTTTTTSTTTTVPSTTTSTTRPPTTTTTTSPPAPAAEETGSPGPRRLLGSFRVTCYGPPMFPQGQVTKSGEPVGPGSIAVDPRVIPLGTELEVEGYGRGRANDIGSKVKGSHVDVWVRDPSPCPVASPARVWVVG